MDLIVKYKVFKEGLYRGVYLRSKSCYAFTKNMVLPCMSLFWKPLRLLTGSIDENFYINLKVVEYRRIF